MELTQHNFHQRLQWLQNTLQEGGESLQGLQEAVHEKGVECGIIVPLLEVLLGFDALADIQYEHVSTTRHGQRFDFLLDGKFLIEAKPLRTNLDEHHDQMARYIGKNQDISFGILTNGSDYQVWLQRWYVERESKNQVFRMATVVPVLELSLEDDSVNFVLQSLSLFSKEQYEDKFSKLAHVAGYYGSGSKGKPPVLHNDKELDRVLRERIKENVQIRKGVYYDQVNDGTMRPGQKLVYSNDWVRIAVEVTETGTVKLEPGDANILDVIGAQQNGWGPMVQLVTGKWMESDHEFEDPLDIIRQAQDKQRLFNKEQYAFSPVSQ